jgi:DNA-binding winged helix-turn-helix (wHTH) protein/tetratricopeptide (TPR) repeat protein
LKVRKDFGKSTERIFYEFGPFRFDSREGELRRDGKLVRLAPKGSDILLFFIQNPGRILTKDEMMKQVWPDTAVEESNLARNVSTLRKALGDGPDQPEYIETIPWRGYRFVAEVRKAHEESEVVDSLAVLPFVNEDQDPATEYLSDGITESLIHKLSLLSNLKVMSWHSVFQYKVRDRTGNLPEAKTVGLDLGVGAVLTGRIRLVDNIVLVGVELVNTRDNRHLWGAQYNRELSNIATLQEAIPQQIAERLKPQLTGQDKQRLFARQRHTENPEAYQLYLKGRHFWNKLTLDSVQKGLEFFQQAIEKDPAYALAYTGMLDCYTYLNSPVEARKSAARALELDPTLGEAHASLGFYKFLYDWDFAGAEKELKHAIELNPNYAQAHHWYGIYLANMGQHQEAIREARLAQQLDPLSLLMNQTVGLVLSVARQYDQAIAELLKVIEMDATYAAAHGTLGLVYAQKGMCEQAILEFEKVASFAGRHPAVATSLKALTAYTYAVCSRPDKARALVDQISAEPTASSYMLAMIYASLGEHDRALDWLGRAYADRDFQVVSLKVDPALDPLRSTTRFQELLARVGLA